MTTAILEVKNLSIDYKSGSSVVHALRGVSLAIGEGEVLGVVGESGSGKSTLALGVSHLLDTHLGTYKEGSVVFLGKDLLRLPASEVNEVRGTGIFMIFQDPYLSLNPLMRIGDQLIEAIEVRFQRASQDFNRQDARTLAIESLKSVRIGDAEDILRRYPHQLSGGQNQRAMLAMAVAEAPKLLIADEPTTALDVTTQGQVLNLLKEIVEETKMSVMYITHDLAVAGSICDRIAVLYGGMVQEVGPTKKILLEPEHPYTVGLIQSIPSGSKKDGRLKAIKGSFDAAGIYNKCAFAPRCSLVHDACWKGIPALLQRDGRSVRCLNYGEEYE